MTESFDFCTYFDVNYLPRGLALHASLRRTCRSFRLFVLCMDELAASSLDRLGLPEIIPIRLSELESAEPRLLDAKNNRSRIEYYFTCTAALPLFVMEKWKDADLVTYVDADLYFFTTPLPLIEELGQRSIGIIAHRFPPHLSDREQYGHYNVGWISFRRDASGIECLRWWRDRCLEWCYDRVEDGRFADQKYLDSWPERFSNVAVLEHPGANLAPWNVDTHTLSSNGQSVLVDSRPLIFFHFHGLKQLGRWTYDPAWKEYGITPTPLLRNHIYLPYIRELRSITRAVSSASRLSHGVRTTSASQTGGALRRLRARFRDTRRRAKEIADGSLIVCFSKERNAVTG